MLLVRQGGLKKSFLLSGKHLRDKMVLYADSNGFYSVEEAYPGRKITGRSTVLNFLKNRFLSTGMKKTRQVAESLTIPVAGGEQESSLHGFRWLIANDGLQIVQPDTYYFGGMIRSDEKLHLWRNAAGKKCTPHMSGGGLGFLYMMHLCDQPCQCIALS